MQLFHMYLCKLYSNTYRVQCRTDLDRKHGSHTDWMDRKAGPRPVVVALASFILVLNSVLVNASTYTATSDRKARSLVNRRVHRNRVLRQSYSNFPSTGISRSAREILQAGATAPRCVFDGGRCALNPGFPTNLGPPTTDTQKYGQGGGYVVRQARERRCKRCCAHFAGCIMHAGACEGPAWRHGWQAQGGRCPFSYMVFVYGGGAVVAASSLPTTKSLTRQYSSRLHATTALTPSG